MTSSPFSPETMAAAERSKEKLVEHLLGQTGVLGIGIGLNEERTGLALKVLVQEAPAALGLPDAFDGLPVLYQITGPIRAVARRGRAGRPAKRRDRISSVARQS